MNMLMSVLALSATLIAAPARAGTLVDVLQNSGDATFALTKPVIIKDLSAKIEKGRPTPARTP